MKNSYLRRRSTRLQTEALEARRVLAAAPLISEFQAANDRTLNDGDGNSSDWIEIFNPTDEPIDLRGWHLTDDSSDLEKWSFPLSDAIPQSKLEIAPSGHLLVFASGQDTDDYLDANGFLHANFKLGADGEFLALVRPDGQTVAHAFTPSYPPQDDDASYGLSFDVDTNELISAGATAKYIVPTGQISNWQSIDFNDAAWELGETGIGYENSAADYSGLIETTVPRGTRTVYLRQTFDVPTASAVDSLVLSLRYDDGFIAYLNGNVVAEENAPNSPSWNSVASSGHPDAAASRFIKYDISEWADRLVDGQNVLAIHSLNTSGSSDMLIETTLAATSSQLQVPIKHGIMERPTPNAANGQAFLGFVSDTMVSVERGFFDQTFSLEVSSSTPNATIIYTTDGTEPSQSNGIRIEPTDTNVPPAGSVRIDQTTVFRAMSFKDDFVPGAITTRSYMFTRDIASSQVMDRDITQDDRYQSLIETGLLDIPSISLAFDTPIDNSTDEQRTSVEWLSNDGEPGFQIDAGIRAFGGEFTNFAKKNFRLYFRGEYGATKLEYPIFEGFDRGIPAAQVFDQLNLRTGSHDMSMRGFYMSNRFTDDTMLDMGHLAPHGRFVNVYLNGTYWGQYHLRERWNADMLSQYNGGNDDDYESINGNRNVGGWSPGEAYDGDGSTWNTIKALRRDYEEIRKYLDVENYIDYMLLYMSGNSENEYRTGGTPNGDSPFQFFLNDADGWLRSVGDRTDNPGPGNILSGLVDEGHPDFMMLLADRIQKMYFNDGALTPERAVARLQERLDEVQNSFIVESARWGYRTPTSWKNAADNAIAGLLPSIAETMLSRLRSRGFTASLAAPILSQHGGSVTPGLKLSLSNEFPSLQEGNLALGKSTQQSSDGFGRTGALAVNGNLADISHTATGDLLPYLEVDLGGEATIDEIVIHNRNNCCQHRLYNISIEIRNASDEVVYISDIVNPVLEGETPTSPGSKITFDLTEFEDVARFVRVKKTAVNGNNSTEWLSLAELQVYGEFVTTSQGPGTYYTLDGVDPRLPGGEIHPDAIVYSSEIDIASGDIVKARNYDGQNWSAIVEAEFDVAKADASNLRVTEVQFNPHDALPQFAELDLDNDEFEFIELRNVGPIPIDLANVRLLEAPSNGELQGINFTFEQGILPAGQYVLLVRNQSAFESRYGTSLNVVGEFTGKLSNSGELLSVYGQDGQIIQQFEYNDSDSWPNRADGLGSSLVVADTSGDYDSAENWQSSVAYGGTPGFDPLDKIGVVINEVLANPSGDQKQAIEIVNSSATTIDLSGWLLSNSNDALFKHELAASTVLSPGEYLVLDESDFHSSNGEAPEDFLLERDGDELWLMETNANGKPLRFADVVSFDSSLVGVSLGRIPSGSSQYDLFPLETNSLGMANGKYITGAIVISEIHYHPDTLTSELAGQLEFVEIFNRSDSVVELGSDVDSWRLRGGINFEFPTTVIAAGESVVVVGFSPNDAMLTNDFRSRYGTPDDVQLLGPFQGKLRNSGEQIELLKPKGLSHQLVDRVTYDDVAPWPVSPNGGGDSLTRSSADSFGDFAESWSNRPPTPGSVSFQVDRILADLDNDGEVGFSDFLLLSTNFGRQDASYEQGDIDGDENVSFADFLILSNEFGKKLG